RRVRTAEDAARMLADYLTTAGQPLAVEAPFEVELGRVRLRGSIDRIEGDETGLRVVDLKTGKVAKSARAAEEDLQLAAYQAAVREGALDEDLGPDAGQRLNGAQLVYVGTPTRRPSVRTQTALPRAEDPAWFDTVVDRVAGEVSGSQVTARVNSHCSRAAVRTSCALQPEGARRGPAAPPRATPQLSAAQPASLLGQPPPTQEQTAVIEAPLAPMLVVAGAGSGKTETMASRVVWLIANAVVEPRQVLGLTFTRKAA